VFLLLLLLLEISQVERISPLHDQAFAVSRHLLRNYDEDLRISSLGSRESYSRRAVDFC